MAVCKPYPSVIQYHFKRLRLKDDGTLATSSNQACRLVTIKLAQARIVPLAGCNHKTAASVKRPSTVLNNFRNLGALAAAIGTFTHNRKPVARPKCFDWAKNTRLNETEPGCEASVSRWSFYCNADSHGDLVFGIEQDTSSSSLATDPITKMPAGTLIVHPTLFNDASGNNLITGMSTSTTHPVPITNTTLSGKYQQKFDALNPRNTTTPTGAYNAVKGNENRTRLGIAKKGTDWELFAVCATSIGISTGTTQGYRIDNLARELLLEGYSEAVLFDAGSPFQLAIWDGTNILADNWGVPASSPSNAFVFVAPKQIHWKKVGNNNIPNSRPDPSAPPTRINPPPTPQDMVVEVDLVNMDIFGKKVKIKAELQTPGASPIPASAINPPEITWTNVDKVSFNVTFDKATLQSPASPVGSDFTLRVQSYGTPLRPNYEIDCAELTLKIRGGRRWCAVVDDSGSMNDNDPAFSALGAVARLAMSLFGNEEVEVGMSIVRFTDSASSLTGGLSADLNHVLAMTGAGHWNHSGGTNITAGLSAALNDLGQPQLFEDRNLLLLTDGLDQNFDYSVVARLRAAGIKVHAVALGSQADRNLLQRIARDTGGQYLHATNISELLRRLGTLEEEVSDAQLVASANLPQPGNLLVFAMADHDMSATLTAASGALDPAQAQIWTPTGRAYTLAQILATPGLVPGVSVVVDPGAGASSPNRFLIVNLDGGTAQPGPWRIGMIDQPTTVRVVEESPPAERYDLTVRGGPENAAVFVGGEPFVLTGNWLVAGIRANASSTACFLTFPSGQQVSIPMNWLGVGEYTWTFNPTTLNLQPGMYEITVACAGPNDSHRRQWHYSFNVYQRLSAVFPEFPPAVVAEESFDYRFQVPGGSQGVNAWLELTDETSTYRSQLTYQGSQDAAAIYGGTINLDNASATDAGLIRVEAIEGDRYALRADELRVLPPRGLWMLTAKGHVAIDLAGKRKGSIAQKISPSAIDGGNGSLWLGELFEGAVWLHSYDRRGHLRKSIKTSGDAVWTLAAYNDCVAAMLRVMEGGKPKAMMVMYKAGEGELRRYPGANSHLLMVAEGELYYGERVSGIGQYTVKIMYLRPGQEPIERFPGFDGNRLEIYLMPDGQVAFWLGRGQPIRGLAPKPPYPELTEKLDGQMVRTDQYGFWLCTVKPEPGGVQQPMKLYRYQANPSDPGQFTKMEVKLPNIAYRTLDGAAISRPAGILFLGQNRMRENLWIFDKKGKFKVVTTGEIIGGLLSMPSNEGPYPS